ncbi:NAD(P)-binding protein [Daedalea quercina L-15889]|uniref:NAD(P)-binding protein n=1 Tax=Daedalea quercina L-15889 TaxID=1314783 RepID=A0A165M0G1_9APHY|nr:NAD(P)-binding protein [Daedalea quercina L-15889]
MDLHLNGVHVLVTGASGGIGLETALLFLKCGASVTAHYNTTSSTLEPVLAEYGTSRIQTVQANFSKEADVLRAFGALEGSPFGAVQVLIANHGYYPPADVPVAEMSLTQWESTFSSNMTSTFLVVREYLKQLAHATEQQKEKASIVIIGSTAGKYGEIGHADYSAVKSAMMYGFAMTLKNEIVKIAPRGRVNCIAPGWVKTPMAEHALKQPEVIYRALATTPLKKVATPEDVAAQVVFVASTAVSGHVSGQVIMVEGGMEGRLLNKPEDISYY